MPMQDTLLNESRSPNRWNWLHVTTTCGEINESLISSRDWTNILEILETEAHYPAFVAQIFLSR
jgi:hypothetical protein